MGDFGWNDGNEDTQKRSFGAVSLGETRFRWLVGALILIGIIWGVHLYMKPNEVYLYKTLDASGRLATFFGKDWLPDHNCKLFATLHYEKYGVPLYCSSKEY